MTLLPLSIRRYLAERWYRKGVRDFEQLSPLWQVVVNPFGITAERKHILQETRKRYNLPDTWQPKN